MRTDAIAVELRPRSEWEAVDLGLELARAWFGPLAAAWAAAYVAPALLLVAASPRPFATAAVAWLLRPWAERALIEILAARCFDRPATLAGALRAVLRAPLRPGAWLASLTWRRVSTVRLAWLAVWQLEGLRGSAARARVRILTTQGRGACGWTMLLGLTATGLIAVSGVIVTLALVPGGTGAETFAWLDGGVPMPLREARTWALLLVASDALCAPWVLAAQFGWYISRRTDLEAWDIELVFRALAGRVAAAGIVLLALLGPASDGFAQTATSATATATAATATATPSFDANATADAILDAPEFGREEIVQQWRLRSWPRGESAPPSPWLVWLLDLMPAIAGTLRWGMWVLALGVVLWLVRLALRGARRTGVVEDDEAASPTFEGAAAGIRTHVPVVSAARDAIDRGRLIDALALLYRGAIGVYTERGLVDVQPGDTEGDYLRHIRGRLQPDADRAVRDVVRAWQAAAYARRLPSIVEAHAMCEAYRLHVDGGDA